MIGRLKGRIEEIGEEHALIDVNGVGYEVFCPSRVLGKLEPGTAAALVIETHVREDHIHLFGFLTGAERELFRRLQTVQGVGPRVALAILGVFSPDTLAQTLAARDAKALTRVSGVGPKMAERLVTELKDKLGGMASTPVTLAASGASAPSGMVEDATLALTQLGIGRTEAYAAVVTAARALGDGADVQTLIKEGLKACQRPMPA